MASSVQNHIAASSSALFRLYLRLLSVFRRPYLWARQRWRTGFTKYLGKPANLDTSRMLAKFNWLHRLFFRGGFEKIRWDRAELAKIEAALSAGPVIFLMKNWGQVEYNFFNHLFLKENLPLVAHNNLVKMGHWMPGRLFWRVQRQKIDRFFTEQSWPTPKRCFDLTQTLTRSQPVLDALTIPETPWREPDLATQEEIVAQWLRAQENIKAPIQLVPLHFLYDKHPTKEKKGLSDILFGDRENPGYLRRMLLFLLSYQKRAVAKIGAPLKLTELAAPWKGANATDRCRGILTSLSEQYKEESHQVTGPKLKSRTRITEEILAGERFQKKLKQLQTTLQIPWDKILKTAKGQLFEISSDVRFKLIEVWSYFLTWMFQRFYGGIVVDEDGIQTLKQKASGASFVFVPSHKSHLDYLILAYIFYHRDLSMPLVCAGENLSFWPLGPVFRRSGAYFIRRSYAGDALYRASLQAYVAKLMNDGYFQEFFIEGTRSRTGKLFPARVGMVRMMVEAYLENPEGREVYFVPTSIDYERVLEEGSYLQEMQGTLKKKERFMDLLRLPKFLKGRYGKVYVQFAKPISLKKRLAKNGVSTTALLDSPADFHAFTSNLAEDTIAEINQVTTLLPAALVAMALLHPKQKSLSLSEIETRVKTLLDLAKDFSPRTSKSFAKDLNQTTQEILNQWVEDGRLQGAHDGAEYFYVVAESQRQALNISQNRGLHALVDAAWVSLLQNVGWELGCESAQRVQQILKREFFFSKSLQEKIAQKTTQKNTLPNKDQTLPKHVGDLLCPTLETYYLSLSTLNKMQASQKLGKTETWLITRNILEQGKLWHLKGELKFPESLCRFTIQHALQTWLELGILKNHQDEMGAAGKKYYSAGPKWDQLAQEKSRLETLLGLSTQSDKTPTSLASNPEGNVLYIAREPISKPS